LAANAAICGKYRGQKKIAGPTYLERPPALGDLALAGISPGHATT
jgi:hypothetical protein